MARPATLSRWLLLGLVVVAHLVGLEWFARAYEEQDALIKPMAPPMYTRMLKPEAPPEIVAQAVPPPTKPKLKPPPPVRIIKPRPHASAPKPVPEAEPEVAQAPQEAASAPEAAASAPDAVAAAEPAASAPVRAASSPVAAASAPVAAASAPAVAASGPPANPYAAQADWPSDTRLSYELGGVLYGGPLYGSAHVQWQREGENYQVRLDLDVKYFVNFVMMSQGTVTPVGLRPKAYEEYRPGNKRRAIQMNADSVALDNGKSVPRLPGLQDTVSQFVDLAHRFAAGQVPLAIGEIIPVPLARPGGVDTWVYDVIAKETLTTPQLGEVEAYHLKPRPLDKPRGDITADIWFAPSLQYLPVKIRISMGTSHYVDLLVDHIEQR
ncbi:DUF3108 domain-containing protein [Ramlibacter sp. G-1-2-2]|uniref:DUF3108 domain-containing protein n=1 Tax=Ramlibacter agri TaxID=2728837 RepID=A0A848GXF0_9BURK|nr:DUF3108 domain-containing protein [Ramlibacter agri]